MNDVTASDEDLAGLAHFFGVSSRDLQSLMDLAITELATGALDHAIETLTVLTDLNPFCLDAWRLLAKAHQTNGSSDLARVYGEFAEGLVP